MSKFYRPDNQYFVNLTSNLFSQVARYTQKEIVSHLPASREPQTTDYQFVKFLDML